MLCTCGNTLELSLDGIHCLSCSHTAALFDGHDGDLLTELEALEPAVHDDDDSDDAHALALDLDDLDSSLGMGGDEMYFLFDF